MALSKSRLASPDVLGELEPETVSLQPSDARGQDKPAMLDSERDRIFGDWLADHQGILFKVVRAYAFEHAACRTTEEIRLKFLRCNESNGAHFIKSTRAPAEDSLLHSPVAASCALNHDANERPRASGSPRVTK